jgi:NADP-dependent 3-hydroxy acid dehydrogenase YdfG
LQELDKKKRYARNRRQGDCDHGRKQRKEMIDVNLKGVLYGIAAALPVFRSQGFGHFVNVISTAGIQITPIMAVYAATKNAVRTITEGLRLEAGDKGRSR